MNFTSRSSGYCGPRVMKTGDLVIIYERHDSLDHFYLSAGNILNIKYGHFHHDDFIGKPFGSKILSRTSNGYMYALEPSPELWSLAVHTRTQIVNELDSSSCILNMDVFPGCTVVESGTGSGCMTLALARAVAPNGHVYTFEYNDTRARTAQEEFKRLGVDHLVTVTCRDVCAKFAEEEGGFLGVPDQSVDAVFLDLPEPWLPMNDVLRVLKPGRTLCTYSPCIEQVMKTCEKLREENFHTIRMLEVRQVPYDGRRVPYEEVDFGLNPNIVTRVNSSIKGTGNNVDVSTGRAEFTAATGGDDSNNTENGSKKKKRCATEEEEESKSNSKGSTVKFARIDGEAGDVDQKAAGLRRNDVEANVSSDIDIDADDTKSVTNTNTDAASTVGGDDALEVEMDDALGDDDPSNVDGRSDSAEAADKKPFVRFADMTEEQKADYFRGRIRYIPPAMPSKEYLTARPMTTMKGHTAFLTFAVRPSINGAAGNSATRNDNGAATTSSSVATSDVA